MTCTTCTMLLHSIQWWSLCLVHYCVTLQAMDWLEERDALVVPSPSMAVMKHLCFFKWEKGTTKEQQEALFAAWKGLTTSMPHCVSIKLTSSLVNGTLR